MPRFNIPYELLGIGATCYVTTTDHNTVLKGHQVWKVGKHYMSGDECENELAREATIYEHHGEHPQVLSGLQRHAENIHSIRLELAPLGCVRQFIEKHANKSLA